MNYESFRKSVLKTDCPHNHKIKDSHTLKEAWRWIKKNKWLDIGYPISEKDFGLIIKTINQYFQDMLLEGKDVKLPHRMGRIEIRKYNTDVKIEDGKIKTSKPIDWKSTLKLWNEDSESYKLRTLVRYDISEKFLIYYNRNKAKYNNKAFYMFIPARVFKKRLRDVIDKGQIDAFLLNTIK